MFFKDQPDISICIPSAQDWPHLYFTLNQCAALLVQSHFTHEIIVCANNTDDPTIEAYAKLITARDFGMYHRARLVVNQTPSNGVAANTAASYATGKYLAFMDDHVVLYPNIFTECVKVLQEHEDAGMVHSPITWTGLPYDMKTFEFLNGKRCFQYLYRTWKPGSDEWYLHQHFHGVYNHHMVSPEPYPIAGCGHGFFMVRNDVWKKVGGYHTGQRAYGGREPFLTFKMWLMGHRNFTVPATCHVHYNGNRNYEWVDGVGHKGNDVWYRNCMMSAYAIGGEPWLDRIYKKFAVKSKPKVIEKLRNEAVEWSTKERKFVLANQLCEFEDLFKLWDEQKVFY